MEISEREHHIKVLEKLLKEIKGKIELYSENKNIDLTKEKDIAETLGYAVSSLKTDEAYQIMYEGGEIYTKADMVAMLGELQDELKEEKRMYDYTHFIIHPELENPKGMFEHSMDISIDYIQQKINAIKEN